MNTTSATAESAGARCAEQRPNSLQVLQQLAGEQHEPALCQPWRGAAGLCGGCSRELQGLLLSQAQRWRQPTAQVELLATLRGLELFPTTGPLMRPASGPELAHLQQERDGALALLGRLAPRYTLAELQAEVDAAAVELGPEGLAGLRTARIAAERGAVADRG